MSAPGRAGARDHPRPVRDARARRRDRCGCRSAPATSSRSPTSSTRSTPTSRADVPAAEHRHDADVRPRRRHRAVDGEPRLLRAVRARADRVDRGARPPSAASSVRHSTPSTSRCSSTSASSTSCARSPSTPRCWQRAAVDACTAPGRHLGARVRRRGSTASTATAGVITDDAALTQARLWLTEACRIGLADALGILGVSAPDGDGAPRRRRRATDENGDGRPETAPFDRSLVPAAACSALDLDELAAEFGTPLFVYDEDHLRARCREFGAEFGPANVAYAGKAFLCLAMARLVADEGLKLDVATGGELARRARRPGFPRSASCSTATTRATSEIEAARECRASVVVVADSFAELERLERIGFAGRGVRAGHARRRSAHPRVHRDRHRAFEVRLLGRERATRSPRSATWSRHPACVRRHPLPHRLAGVPARLVREGRGGGRRRVRGRVRAR